MYRAKKKLIRTTPMFIPYDKTSMDMKITCLEFRDLLDIEYTLPVETICRKVFSGSKGKVLSPKTSEKILKRYMKELEEKIRDLCSQHSVLFWLCLARRIEPGLRRRIRLTTEFLYRNVLTAAILKYGNKKKEDIYMKAGEGIRSSGISVPTKEWFPKVGQTKREKFEAYKSIFQIESLCLAYYLATGYLRRIFKGEKLKINKEGFPGVQRDRNLTDLMGLYDRRQEKYPSLFQTFGLRKSLNLVDLENLGKFYGMILRPNLERREFDMYLGEEKKRFRQINKFLPNYLPLIIDLEKYYKLLLIFREDLIKRLNLSPEEVICFLVMFVSRLAIMYRNSPTRRYNLLLTAYALTPQSEILVDDFSIGFQQFYFYLFSEKIDRKKAKEAVLRLMDLFQHDMGTINLWDRGPLPLFIKFKNSILTDYSAFPDVLPRVLTSIPPFSGPTGQARGKNFEKEVRGQLKKDGFNLWVCSKKLKVLDVKPMAEIEIDASFYKEDTLVVIGCRSHHVTKEYDRGEPAELEKRWDFVLEGLKDAEKRCDFIYKYRKHKLNYPLPGGVKYIVPILCSPFTEYIPTKDDNFFLVKKRRFENSIPRICVPEELTFFFKKFKSDLIKNNPYTLTL